MRLIVRKWPHQTDKKNKNKMVGEHDFCSRRLGAEVRRVKTLFLTLQRKIQDKGATAQQSFLAMFDERPSAAQSVRAKVGDSS
jgi:hypothetical protein